MLADADQIGSGLVRLGHAPHAERTVAAFRPEDSPLRLAEFFPHTLDRRGELVGINFDARLGVLLGVIFPE
jgi:hypothetical protein